MHELDDKILRVNEMLKLLQNNHQKTTPMIPRHSQNKDDDQLSIHSEWLIGSSENSTDSTSASNPKTSPNLKRKEQKKTLDDLEKELAIKVAELRQQKKELFLDCSIETDVK